MPTSTEAFLVPPVPSPKVIVDPVPKAFAATEVPTTVPCRTVRPVEKVFAPESISVPTPALVSVMAPPPITPPTVRLPLLIVIVRLALGVTAPAPKFKSLDPAKVKSPFHDCAYAEVVIAAPEVLSIVPPVIVKVLAAVAPSAAALLMFNVPALSDVPPAYVFTPESVTVPPVVLLRPAAPARMALAKPDRTS